MKKAMMLAAAVMIGLLAHKTGLAQEPFKGEWSGHFENKGARLSLQSHRNTSILDSWLSFEIENIKGLPIQASSDAAPIHFEIVREAGTIVFDGMVKNGHGTTIVGSGGLDDRYLKPSSEMSTTIGSWSEIGSPSRVKP